MYIKTKAPANVTNEHTHDCYYLKKGAVNSTTTNRMYRTTLATSRHFATTFLSNQHWRSLLLYLSALLSLSLLLYQTKQCAHGTLYCRIVDQIPKLNRKTTVCSKANILAICTTNACIKRSCRHLHC